MTATSSSILQRMAGAERTPPDHGVVSPFGAMRLALSKAAQDIVKANLVGGQVADLRVTLRGMEDVLPEGGLWVVLQGHGRTRGLICVDPSLLAALVQAMTTGKVTGSDIATRRPTQTDALLVRRVLGCVLDTFVLRLAGHPAEDWARGFQPRDRVSDPARLPHVLPDVVYRALSMEVDICGGLRSGSLVILLPRTGGEEVSPETVQRAAFAEAMGKTLRSATAELEAVLHRIRMPISEMTALEPGMVLTLPRDSLANVVLHGCDGRVVGRAKLGQSRGNRAVKLIADKHAASAAKAKREELPETNALATLPEDEGGGG
ncbi:hypothetical protein G5B39_07700 [Rhodobacteraceae bacterium SC52]|nr:hypothetical protein G5B39_07700 [Rhodobacteraceae bacterium SC52]